METTSLSLSCSTTCGFKRPPLAITGGRTETFDGDFVAELAEKGMVHEWQFFPSSDRKRFVALINMDFVESVRVVNE